MKHLPKVSSFIVYSYVAFSLIPIAWMLVTSLRTRLHIVSQPLLSGMELTFKNYSTTYAGMDVFGLVLNSAIVAAASTLGLILLCGPASFIFAHYPTRFANQLFTFAIATRLISPIAVSLPLFVLIGTLGLRGSYLGIIAGHMVINLSLAVWLLRGYSQSIPSSLVRAARMDGLSLLQSYLSVALPLTRQGMLFTTLLVFLFSWNEFLLASLLSNSQTQTLTQALPALVTQGVTRWGQLCALATMASTPVFLVLLLFAKLIKTQHPYNSVPVLGAVRVN